MCVGLSLFLLGKIPSFIINKDTKMGDCMLFVNILCTSSTFYTDTLFFICNLRLGVYRVYNLYRPSLNKFLILSIQFFYITFSLFVRNCNPLKLSIYP